MEIREHAEQGSSGHRPTPPGGRIDRFGDFDLDVSGTLLLRSGRPVALRRTPLRLLRYLVDHRERVVPRDELLDAVWDGVRVGDAAVASALKELRQALGDSATKPRFVATLRGRGYRFVARVHERTGDPDARIGERPCVAVLPFLDLSSGETGFADGITEDVITLLSRAPGLSVVARSSTFAYRGGSPDVREVGASLGAGYVIEGSVRLRGDRLRVTVQLVEAEGGRHVFAEKLDQPVDDLFAVEDRLVERIVAQLATEVVRFEGDRAAGAVPESLDAWTLFHRAVSLEHFGPGGPDGLREAAELLDRSLTLAPDFAPALARRAVLHAHAGSFRPRETYDPDAERQQALATSRRALELAPFDANVVYRRGVVLATLEGPESGLPYVTRALELHPLDAHIQAFHGSLLARTGREAEGAEAIGRALRLAPRDPRAWAWENWRAVALFAAGDPEEALAANERAMAGMEASPFPWALRAALLARLGRMQEAHAAVARLREVSPRTRLRHTEAALRASNPARGDFVDEVLELLRRAGLE